MALYPLLFRPRFVEKIWGGRKIETVLGKSLPPGKQVGESWELYDFPPGVVDDTDKWVSVPVANGPLAGRTLHELVAEHGRELMGDVALTGDAGQFPLLVKYLDAREDLSVQVHPDAAYAADNPGAHLKTEAWYVVEHEPDARLLMGLVPGTAKAAFADAIAAGTVEDRINAVRVRPGDCHFLPSGTVHALGAGILVAEVQTPSDTTYRVFDFNRVEPATGQPRTLHVEQAMACIDFDTPTPPEPPPRFHSATPHTTVSRLVTSEFFQIDKVRIGDGIEQPIPHQQPVVWMVLDGTAEVRVDGLREPTRIKRGDTVLLPAGLRKPILRTTADCAWLEVTFPNGR